MTHDPNFTWEPPIGSHFTPGFLAARDSLTYALGFTDVDIIGKLRIFIDKLEDEGYCIAKFDGDRDQSSKD